MQEVLGGSLGRIGFCRCRPLAKQGAAAHRRAGTHPHVVGDTGGRPLGLGGQCARQRPDVTGQRLEFRTAWSISNLAPEGAPDVALGNSAMRAGPVRARNVPAAALNAAAS